MIKYEKNINFSDNTSDQPSKHNTKNWVIINDDASRSYNANSHVIIIM